MSVIFTRLRLVVPSLAFLLFAWMSPQALAAFPNHPLLTTIRGIPVPPPRIIEPFDGACGVAVDDEQHVYVTSYYRNLIYAFISAEPTQIHRGPSPSGPCDLAFDSQGHLYVNDLHEDVVRLDGESPETIDSDFATGVAVDPADDRVYVAHRHYISVYKPSGDPVLSEGAPLRIGLSTLGSGYGLAVSAYPQTAGDLFIADAADNTIKVYDPTGNPSVPVEVFDGAGTPQGRFNDLVDADLAVDPSNGHILVVDNLQPHFEHPGAVVDELGYRGNYRSQLPHSLIHGEPSGLAISGGNIYVTSGNEESAVYVFGPEDSVPTKLLQVAVAGSGNGTLTSDPARINCGSACLAEFTAGEAATLTATADPHSAFLGWTVNGSPTTCPGTTTCQLTLDADTEVSAEFEALPQHDLGLAKSGTGGGTIASQPAGIDCSSSCAADTAEFNAGGAITLTATADPHSAFLGWTVNGSPTTCPGTTTCQLTLDADTEVSAEFEALPRRTLTVSTRGNAPGKVISEPFGIDCGPICTRTYDQGAVVTLFAKAGSGSQFTDWSGADCSGTGACELVLTKDTVLIASFEQVRSLCTTCKGGAPENTDWSLGPARPLRVAKIAIRGSSATLRVVVPAAGSLTATGKGLKKAMATTVAPTTVTLRLQLSWAARASLASKGKLKRTVELAFAPVDGSAVTVARQTVTFKSGRRGR